MQGRSDQADVILLLSDPSTHGGETVHPIDTRVGCLPGGFALSSVVEALWRRERLVSRQEHL
jgi:hypothetical protein